MKKLTIIGGGLCGLGLANGLAGRGVPVEVHEAGSYPRHKVCGEFLAGLKATTLQNLGLTDCLKGSCIHRKVGWFRNSRCVRRYVLPSPAHGLSRYRMDQRLADSAREKGALVNEQSRSIPRLSEGTLLTVGNRPQRSGWVGLKLHYSNLDTEEDLEVHMGNRAYVGLSAVEGNRLNVCGLFRGASREKTRCPTERFLQTLRLHGLGALAERLSGAQPHPESFSSVAGLDYRSSHPNQFGDAHRLIPPFTGHGMTLALETAELLVNPLLQYHSGQLNWEEALSCARRSILSQHRRRHRVARFLHPLVYRPTSQIFLIGLAKSGLLPFRFLFGLTHH